MLQWLENFTYKVTLDWWVFILATAVSVIVALTTTAIHSYNVATINPGKILKDE